MKWYMNNDDLRVFFVTGGLGFIGSGFIRHVLSKNKTVVVNVDALTYAAQPSSLGSILSAERHVFFKADICDWGIIRPLLDQYQPDVLINFAAESHVDRSIIGPAEFARTNIEGTLALLEACRSWLQERAGSRPFRFLQVSTDEVYGDLGPNGAAAQEGDAWSPGSPYAASKAAADHLVDAWVRTYGFPALVSHASNNYGPWQYPEKLIPLVIQRAIRGEPIPIYGSGEQVRDWLHVEDHVRALWCLINNGAAGEHYNIGARQERRNIDLVVEICALLDSLSPATAPPGGHAVLIDYVDDRLGHDWRYALDTSKISVLGWQPTVPFEQGLRDTVAFYLDRFGSEQG